VEHGENAATVVELMASVSEALRADRSVGAVICATMAAATTSDGAAWVCFRDAEQPELIAAQADSGFLPKLFAATAVTPPPAPAAEPNRRPVSGLGELLLIAPGRLPRSAVSGARHVLAMARRRGFGETDVDLARTAIPALTIMLPQVVAASERQRRSTARRTAAGALGLTDRELEVLQLLAEGLLATSIASKLSLSPRTVHKHLGNIYEKMGVHDRLVAVSMARDLDLVG
jgi:DNA-binding CsgD family transcriptional regulator